MVSFEVGDIVRRTYGKSGGMETGDTATVKEIIGSEWMNLVEYPNERHLMERFELVERKEKTMQERIDEINKAFNDIVSKDNKRELEKAKQLVSSYRLDINRYERHLNDLWNNYKNAMSKVKVLSNETEKDYTSDIEAILNHRYVTKVSPRGNVKVIEIETDYIDIYDERGNKFKGNKYLLHFDFGDMTCYIEGLDEDYNRKSYWTEHDPHPHVNGDEGEACWGSAGSMLVENMNNYELYASFIIVLNFLQQVNTDDPAGAYIRNWDCIDEEGNDLDNPYDKECKICNICDEELDEDDAYYCEDCGGNMCSEHKYWIDQEGKYVCESCYEEDYACCDNCYERARKFDVIWYGDNVYCDECYSKLIETCHECGEEFRKDEMNLIDDEWYCGECSDELFTGCHECDETVKREDTFYCGECGGIYCTSCKEEVEEGVCEDCYKGEEE